ncbi:hypothetical protein IFM89_012800 [Coptis chinensis]|uniref:KIB1-4 beta-propeller domain-containing protein n=1 Tax=Coptis chinensis TaxID=261450 RepID=A0A835LHS9_9MAGN|nr:hypothetical protein IFM89_012800 [Coptis chinensis]
MTTAKKNRSLLPPARRPAPWLVIPNGADANRLNFFNVSDSENNSYIRTCEENLEKECVASMHGWLVMMDLWISEEVHCFLWNPDTREKIDLPSWDVEAPEDIEEYIVKAISCKDGIIYALTTQSVAVIIDRKSCGTLSVRLVEIQKEDVNTVPKTELEMEMADNKFATVEEPVEESIGFRWINLPMDILRSIAMCLHSSADFVNFGRVCKSFASSIPQSPLTTQYPQLMFSNRTSLCSFCDPMHNVTYCFDMPDLLGARIRFSKDGWCLMSKGDYSMFFFNPFTKVTVTLPDLPPKHWANDGFSFTQVPTSPDCIVFGIAGFHKFYVQILYLHLGEDAWTQEYRENEVEFFPSNNNLVFHDGAFYCLGAERYLGVLI